MEDLILTGGTVVTMDGAYRVISGGAVAVKDGRITAVGTAEQLAALDAARVVRTEGKIVLPGLINCHSHAGHCIVGKLETDSMYRWWPMLIEVYENYADAAFWHADGALHACAALRNGITTSVNVMGSTPMGDCPEIPVSHAAGYAGVGGREILGVGIPHAETYPKTYTRWKNGKRAALRAGVDDMLAGTEEALKTVHNAHGGLTQVFVTPHQQLMGHEPGEKNPANLTRLTQLELDINRKVRVLARKYATQVYTDTYGGWVTLAYTDKENMLLGEDVLIGMEHVAATDYREVQIIAETGTKVYYTSEGLYKRVPVSELMALGVPVSITTNGCAPRTTLDLLEALRRAVLAERIFHDDAAYLHAARALACVTTDAARCIGRAHDLGSLEAGKCADIAVLDASRADMLPLTDPLSRIVTNAAGGDFCMTIVGGKVVFEDGTIRTVDERDVLREADEVHARMVRDLKLEDYACKPIWGKTRMEFI